jgi:hypothetical protein
MDNAQKMDVVVWQDSPQPIIAKNRAARRFLSPTLIGVLGTLLLHTIVIRSLPFVDRGSKAKTPEAQESADALVKSIAGATESLVLVTLSTPAKSNQAASQYFIASLPDLSKMKIKSHINVDPPALANLETLALSDDQTSASRAQGGDTGEQARLFGIYTGQIQARIDRVWRRPRTPINEDNASATNTDLDDSFQCQAQIVQDAAGNVQEILLPQCNGSSTWQHSLVSAIRQASPLPAPPNVSVFRQSITLNFVGVRFIPGDAEDDYEPAPRALVSAK